MGKWTYELALEEAKEFNSLNEWQTGHQASYAWALRNKLQRRIAEELGWEVQKQRTDWTYESALEEAKKYKSLGEWSIKHRASYKWALKNRLHRRIAEELGWEVQERTDWTYELALKEAKKYKSLREWQTKHPASYQWAIRNKLHRRIAEELGWEVQERTDWTYELALEEAKKYKSLGEWSIKHQASYKWATKNKLQRKIAEELGWKVKGDKYE